MDQITGPILRAILPLQLRLRCIPIGSHANEIEMAILAEQFWLKSFG
jgi:hypothetical protein